MGFIIAPVSAVLRGSSDGRQTGIYQKNYTGIIYILDGCFELSQ